eukprot:11179711-Lingulodinium_polyedra.AAC.1
MAWGGSPATMISCPARVRVTGKRLSASRAASELRAAATFVHERVAAASPAAWPVASGKYCIRSARLGPLWRPA